MPQQFFPTQNRHHLTVEQHRHTDFERIEDIAADAIAALRDALDRLDELDVASTLQQRHLRDELRRLLSAGDMLTDASRQHLCELNAALDEHAEDRDPSILERPRDALARALRDADRVADLLAAERHISRSRRH